MPPQHDDDDATAARAVLGANPTRELTSQTSNYFRNKKRNQPVSMDAAKDRYTEWLQNVQALPETGQRCLNWNTKTFSTACTCLATIDLEATSQYMANFVCLPVPSRQVALKKIVQGANVKKSAPSRQKRLYKGRFYFVPISDTSFAKLCLQSFLNLFQIRTEAWNRLRDDVKLNSDHVEEPLHHGNKGNSHGSSAESFVIEFLTELQDSEGTPYESSFIQDIKALGAIDNAEMDIVELPPFYTKRRLFARFCYAQGKLVKIVSKDKGNQFGRIEDMTDREDGEWADRAPGPVCNYSSFCDLWKKRFPNLQIRGAQSSKGPCHDCLIYRNLCGGEEADGANQLKTLNEFQHEELLLAAGRHVKSARAQQGAIEKRISQAKASRKVRETAYDDMHEMLASNNPGDAEQEQIPDLFDLSGKEFEELLHIFHPELVAEATDCIFINFTQDMGLPHFGSNKFAEATHCFTAKSVFCFGVADASIEPARLYAYCYQEEFGRKGGHEMSSMIMDFLERTGRTRFDGRGNPVKRKRLTVAADNYAGENKSNPVLRLAMYLVEKGFYEEVEMLFYCKGHMKSACDKGFNRMRTAYHGSDICTFDFPQEDDNLVNVLGKARDIEIIKVTEHFFKDWRKIQDKLYRQFSRGTISDYNVFHVKESVGATKVCVKTDCREAGVSTKMLQLQRKVSMQQRAAILNEVPTALAPLPLAEVKQVELFTKWRPHIREELRDVVAPRPTDVVLDRVQAENIKKATRRSRKRKRAPAS